MKKIVWLNKSNGQLCVTIPKNSGIKEGDIVSLEKENIKTIVYTPLVGDLFHYGHLRLLEAANELGDFHVCGVLTDEAVRSYKDGVVTSFKERKAIISSLRCIDMVTSQSEMDPTENLKKLHEQFRQAKLILIYGSDWKDVPGSKYIKEIKGEIVQPDFYEKLSTENIWKKFKRVYEK